MPRKFKYPDVVIAVAVLALIAVGLVANYSTSYSATGGAELFHFERQLLWAAVGLGCLLLAMLMPTRVIQSLAYVFYGFGVLLLIIVLFAGEGAGSARWFAVGPVHFQPSEFMKVALIIGLARLLADNIKTIARPRVFLG
ncbi:FtsW/RodA/SpoVE family cell cycle protein, partial [bacterium]|nr:FtsW/RodA/SpoVE family cell cycle protein [bacterium]